MTDIIERLLDKDAVVLSGLFHAIPTMREAAAEIKRLRAERDRAQESCQMLGVQLVEQAEAIQRLRTALCEIDRIVRTPTSATKYRSAEVHFQADFDAIRKITEARP